MWGSDYNQFPNLNEDLPTKQSLADLVRLWLHEMVEPSGTLVPCAVDTRTS